MASKSAKEILAASKAAAVSADSVHVVGKNSQGAATFAIDLDLGKDEGRAKVSLLDKAFEVVRTGNTLYVKGTPAFYQTLTGTGEPVPQHTWLKGTTGGKLTPLAAFTNLQGELNRMLSTPGTVTKGAATTVNGQKVVELKETTKVYKGSLYVATSGKPYPVQIVKSGGRETGRTTFSEWNKDVSLSAPSPAVDVNSLKG